MVLKSSQPFDPKSLKNMTIDELIGKCRDYVQQFLSKSRARELDKAYQREDYDTVKKILEETIKKVEEVLEGSTYKKVKEIIQETFPELPELPELPEPETPPDPTEKNKGRLNRAMELTSGMIIVVIVVGLLVTAAIGAAIYKNKGKKKVNEVLSSKPKTQNRYTEKDRDMMGLIHELSLIYQTTDAYLKS